MNDIKQWFKNLIATNYFFTKLQNTEDISSPIVKAIKDKEIPILDPKQVSQPIVEALEAIREAVEDKEGVEEVTVKNITDAKADLTEVVSVLKDILNRKKRILSSLNRKKLSLIPSRLSRHWRRLRSVFRSTSRRRLLTIPLYSTKQLLSLSDQMRKLTCLR